MEPVGGDATMDINKADKPGDWMVASGGLLLLLALGLGSTTLFGFMPKYNALRDHGRVAQGIVTEHVDETRTSNKGRTRHSHAVLIGYNPALATPYNLSAEADEDTPIASPSARKAMSGDELVASLSGIVGNAMSAPTFPNQYRMGVSKEEQTATPLGTKISITFLPEAPDEAQLTEDVRTYSPLLSLLGTMLLTIGSIVCFGVGIRAKTRAAAKPEIT
jgi:hypothetical protein